MLNAKKKEQVKDMESDREGVCVPFLTKYSWKKSLIKWHQGDN